jgi:L-aspartate oxidase
MTDLLLSDDGSIAGAVVRDANAGRVFEISARAVLLATGGIGRVFKETTNPDIATGDGVAAAFRAGAEICDIEFVQFHPTALHVAGAPRFLLSEALRGEGAFLRNDAGERFMERYHALKELAPRDVVSRSIAMELRRTGAEHVYLDLRHIDGEHLRRRFPRIYQTCLRYGVDLASDLAPVHPAAHYAMGGIRTDLDGKTTLARLYSAGEAACTGVHGANRLASNSLLEGIVFGARAGRAMRNENASAGTLAQAPTNDPRETAGEETRRLIWEKCGILRSGEGLQSFLASGAACSTIGRLIALCALARRESRGAHYRLDYPAKDPAFEKHSVIDRSLEVRFV